MGNNKKITAGRVDYGCECPYGAGDRPDALLCVDIPSPHPPVVPTCDQPVVRHYGQSSNRTIVSAEFGRFGITYGRVPEPHSPIGPTGDDAAVLQLSN